MTEYWAWYRQRLRRILTGERLPTASYVKHRDRMTQFYESMDYYSHLFTPKVPVIVEELHMHLPYLVHDVRCTLTNDQGMTEISPNSQTIQERWCEQEFGARDKEWLYLGMAMWAFRLEEQAAQFGLTWS